MSTTVTVKGHTFVRGKGRPGSHAGCTKDMCQVCGKPLVAHNVRRQR